MKLRWLELDVKESLEKEEASRLSPTTGIAVKAMEKKKTEIMMKWKE